MLKIKILRESTTVALETAVNEWLEEYQNVDILSIDVKEIHSGISIPSVMIAVILYGV